MLRGHSLRKKYVDTHKKLVKGKVKGKRSLRKELASYIENMIKPQMIKPQLVDQNEQTQDEADNSSPTPQEEDMFDELLDDDIFTDITF